MSRVVLYYLIGAFGILLLLFGFDNILGVHGIDLSIIALIIYTASYILWQIDAFATVFVAYLLVTDKLDAVYQRLQSKL